MLILNNEGGKKEIKVMKGSLVLPLIWRFPPPPKLGKRTRKGIWRKQCGSGCSPAEGAPFLLPLHGCVQMGSVCKAV